MIVADVGAIVSTVPGEASRELHLDAIESHGGHDPHLVDAEVLRRLKREQRRRIDVEPFLRLPRVWTLRANFSAYDGFYVALAEALGCGLATLDKRLARAARDHTSLEVITP